MNSNLNSLLNAPDSATTFAAAPNVAFNVMFQNPSEYYIAQLTNVVTTLVASVAKPLTSLCGMIINLMQSLLGCSLLYHITS